MDVAHDDGGGIVMVRSRRPFKISTSLELFANLDEARQQRLPFSFAHGIWRHVPISEGEVVAAHCATLREFESLGNLAPWASAPSGTQAVFMQIEDASDASGIQAEAAAVMCPPFQAG